MILAGIATFIVCVFSGLLTGLLGIGGGLVIVPFFMCVLPLFKINFSITQIVAISTTCVFLNSAVTVFYRRKQEYLPKDRMIKLACSIIIGTVTGSYITSLVPDKIIYGIYIIICSLSLILFNKTVFIDLKKHNAYMFLYFAFAFIGATSSMIGIGGEVLFATALKCFIVPDTKALLPSITLLVLVHAFFAFSSKIILGEVIFYMIPIAMLASIIGSKIGVKIAEKASAKAI